MQHLQDTNEMGRIVPGNAPRTLARLLMDELTPKLKVA